MRMELALVSALSLCAVAAGCGAKVTVDTPSSSTGGAGGATTSTGTPTDTTGTGTSCSGTSCSQGSDGSCDCQGTCNAQKLEVQCTPIQGGASCTCIENAIKIAQCTQAGGATCGFTAGCCAAQFFPGSTTGAGG